MRKARQSLPLFWKASHRLWRLTPTSDLHQCSDPRRMDAVLFTAAIISFIIRPSDDLCDGKNLDTGSMYAM